MKVLILGASGYGGGELLRLLQHRDDVDGVQGVSRGSAGKPFASVHPNLLGVTSGEFVGEPNWEWLADSDRPVLFAAMPHGEFAKQLSTLEDAWQSAGIDQKLTVIDLSGDFRLSDPEAFELAYGHPHPCPERLGSFAYGLPEWNADAIKAAKRIANPGCFATALQLAIHPLVNVDELEFIAFSGVTGSSGSGMNPSETTHHPTRANDFRAYKVLSHQHAAEVDLMLTKKSKRLAYGFVPHSAPMVRGIFVTAQFQWRSDAEDLGDRVRKAYETAPFVRIRNGTPRIASVVGSNFADIGYAAQGGTGAIMVTIDNLVKGMAGQAMHNLNLSMGLPETKGLWFSGTYPS